MKIRLPPIFGKGYLQSFGIEDCRVSTMEDGYYMTYTQVSRWPWGWTYHHERLHAV